MFAINWNVTAPDAPTVAMADLSFIAFPFLNGLGKMTARSDAGTVKLTDLEWIGG